jgi:lysozyme family protein
MNFDPILTDIIQLEGGYVNDPTDRGGETNYGITVTTARAAGYTGAMRDMPISVAKGIYLTRYIQQPKFDLVASVSEAIATKLIDQGVNMGPGTAIKFLQRALNLFNNNQSAYPDISEDGQIGPGTLGTLNRYLQIRSTDGVAVMIKMLGILQGARYIQIATDDKSQEKYIYGWIKNRV